MSIEQISAWVNSHQLLVISVAVPIFSALVATAASWYATRKTLKANKHRMNFEGVMKIAEFRQAWINNLRDEMAEFQSYGVHPESNPAQERIFYKLGTKIELLMNPNDPDYPELQQQMYAFLSVSDGDTVDKYSQNPKFIELCQRILKREWDRLKRDIQSASNSL